MRGDTSLASNEYDSYLASRAKQGNKGAMRELEQRKADKRCAHKSDGTGWHFGLATNPILVEHKEDLRPILAKQGLMLEVDRKVPIKLKKGQC